MYTLDLLANVLRCDGVVIPNDDSTPEYQEYVAWLRNGNGPQLVEGAEPVYPRIEVTAWQLVQALAARGWLQQVEDVVARSDDPLVRYGWQRAPEFFSDQPLTIGLAAELNKSRAELQALFELAASYVQ